MTYVFSFYPNGHDFQCSSLGIQHHQYKQHPLYDPYLELGSLPSQNIRATVGNRTNSRTLRSSGAEGASSRIIFISMMGNYFAIPVDPCMSHCTQAMQESLGLEEGSATTALNNSEIFPKLDPSPPSLLLILMI